ncbi:hypothetical protein LCGC14_1775350 [marine sediment metagenome]|uniref:Uncharacterized protein n=1 Tax=marine sediment metagenome TaxID=412755 RepID=A0A0F9JWR8_9ZZZZ
MCPGLEQILKHYTDGLITDTEAWRNLVVHVAECRTCLPNGLAVV